MMNSSSWLIYWFRWDWDPELGCYHDVPPSNDDEFLMFDFDMVLSVRWDGIGQ